MKTKFTSYEAWTGIKKRKTNEEIAKDMESKRVAGVIHSWMSMKDTRFLVNRFELRFATFIEYCIKNGWCAKGVYNAFQIIKEHNGVEKLEVRQEKIFDIAFNYISKKDIIEIMRFKKSTYGDFCKNNGFSAVAIGKISLINIDDFCLAKSKRFEKMNINHSPQDIRLWSLAKYSPKDFSELMSLNLKRDHNILCYE